MTDKKGRTVEQLRELMKTLSDAWLAQVAKGQDPEGGSVEPIHQQLAIEEIKRRQAVSGGGEGGSWKTYAVFGGAVLAAYWFFKKK